jgi:hypothetical protein
MIVVTWYGQKSGDYFEAHFNGGHSGDGVTLMVQEVGGRFKTWMNGKPANCSTSYDTADEAKDAVLTWARNRLRETLKELGAIEHVTVG